MKFDFNERVRENILILTVSGAILLAIWFLLRNVGNLAGFFAKFVSAVTPFILGLALAFILLPLRRRAESVWLAKTPLKDKTKRRVAVLITMIIFALVIATFFMVLIPQLGSSMGTLINSMDGYMRTVEKWVAALGDSQYAEIIETVYGHLRTNITQLITNAATMVPRIINYSVNIVSSIFDFFIGVIIALYILLDEEKFTNQVRMVVNAVFNKSGAERLSYVWRLTSSMFNSFIFGKALDSLIIGVLCWFCTSIMRIPYTPLIAFVIGITNMIPVFGPFIGAIPCIFILLIISPTKALEFTIFILILQQIDGNIIGPRILGDSMGLPALWVMFAILVGGALFGIIGMFVGVPIFSVIYYLCKDLVISRLADKKINIDTQ